MMFPGMPPHPAIRVVPRQPEPIEYEQRPQDPPLGRLEAALRRVAVAAYFEADEKQRLLATINRLEDENADLRDQLSRLEGKQGWGRLQRGLSPFGSVQANEGAA